MQKTLEVLTTITAEKIVRAESTYYETVKEIASRKRLALRDKSFIYRHRGKLKGFLKVLSVIGSFLVIIDFLPYGYCQPDYLKDFLFLSFFIGAYFFAQKADQISETMWLKLNNLICERITENTSK